MLCSLRLSSPGTLCSAALLFQQQQQQQLTTSPDPKPLLGGTRLHACADHSDLGRGSSAADPDQSCPAQTFSRVHSATLPKKLDPRCGLPMNVAVRVALHLLQVERTTNHDVKAVEYVLKENFAQHPELAKV